MACSECGSSPISFSVPEEYRSDAPAEAAVVSLCPHCLTVEPVTDEQHRADTAPDFSRVGDGFPTRPERAVPLALALGLCSSLATNRTAIELLLREVERTGADPLLILERLGTDPSVDPVIDLERRRHQLEQLLY
ncbi:DUF6276 family protein [Natrinema salaciae]|uniref:Small CPxCG-related zinc finger protein n=1 Tax=Natrinema salaciae TaxID=1186196 RepID=A0A1H9MQ65_9EURY|nr:DUF6276 family protein [Natrinema salaciae]SER25649.1 hypothetical protein SAMN04489841_3447 [Natrinema salaciae]